MAFLEVAKSSLLDLKENSKARILGKTCVHTGKVNLGETKLRFPHGLEFWLFLKFSKAHFDLKENSKARNLGQNVVFHRKS